MCQVLRERRIELHEAGVGEKPAPVETVRCWIAARPGAADAAEVAEVVVEGPAPHVGEPAGETRPFEPRECERGTCRLAGREQRLVAYLQIAAVTGCELCDACPREAVLCPERELAEGKCPLDFDPGIL